MAVVKKDLNDALNQVVARDRKRMQDMVLNYVTSTSSTTDTWADSNLTTWSNWGNDIKITFDGPQWAARERCPSLSPGGSYGCTQPSGHDGLCKNEASGETWQWGKTVKVPKHVHAFDPVTAFCRVCGVSEQVVAEVAHKDRTTQAHVHHFEQDPTGAWGNCVYCGVPVDVAAKAAQGPRQPAPRAFNRFLNASDSLGDFVDWLRSEGLSPEDAKGISIELFVKWLIVRAAEFDGEAPPDDIDLPMLLPAKAERLRCIGCGRFARQGQLAPGLLAHDARCIRFALDRMAVA